ncbi:MAG: cyclic-phosphate processing receiver domain-containing protein [Acidobacteriota bacterium]
MPLSVPATASPRVCPQCGFSHLRTSRAHTWWERTQTWWTRTQWFRCDTCRWRGRLRDLWKPDEAFPELPPLRLGRDLDIDPLQQRDEDALVDLVLSRAESLQGAIDLWLDDSRPAPPSWLRVTTVRNAQRMLEARLVRELSLDYDLGWCADCIAQGEHMKHSGLRHCEHTPTGYDLVQWMAETEHWPAAPPTVHSGNVEGGARMLGMIARYWHEGAKSAPGGDGVTEADQFLPLDPPVEVTSQIALIGPDAAVATLTMCPRCHGPHLYRTHRHSSTERFRSLVTRRYPVRCSNCGWTFWAKDPILIRMSSTTAGSTERIDNSRFEKMDPD